jgi:hypothetical protein
MYQKEKLNNRSNPLAGYGRIGAGRAKKCSTAPSGEKFGQHFLQGDHYFRRG